MAMDPNTEVQNTMNTIMTHQDMANAIESENETHMADSNMEADKDLASYMASAGIMNHQDMAESKNETHLSDPAYIS
jgi:hypothetical protein